jgi:hypothetical protein
LHSDVNFKTLARRYAKYKQQNNNITPATDPTIDHRNQYRQIFTTEQENTLAPHIRKSIESNSKFFNQRVIRTEATLFYNQYTTRQTKIQSERWMDSTFQSKTPIPHKQIENCQTKYRREAQ